MKKYSLLVGNDINNIIPKNSWEDLLREIVTFCDANKLANSFTNKPLQLLIKKLS